MCVQRLGRRAPSNKSGDQFLEVAFKDGALSLRIEPQWIDGGVHAQAVEQGNQRRRFELRIDVCADLAALLEAPENTCPDLSCLRIKRCVIETLTSPAESGDG